jgi:hypothetical protein
MPNGGVLASCQVCQWAKRTQHSHQAYCRRHQLTIFFASYTFCPDLSHERTPGLAAFATSAQLTPDTMYAYFEIGPGDTKYPHIGNYYHEYLPLGSIQEYASWSEEECRAVVKALYEQWHEGLQFEGDR